MKSKSIYNFNIHTISKTIIERVRNLGYGGDVACVGIQSVLLNQSLIRIDMIENQTSNNYTNNTNTPFFQPPIATGIVNVVQNGYSSIGQTTTPDSNGNTIYSFLPPYPPQNYDLSGIPIEVNAL